MGRNGLAASVENKFMSPRRRRGEKSSKLRWREEKRAPTHSHSIPRDGKKYLHLPPSIQVVVVVDLQRRGLVKRNNIRHSSSRKRKKILQQQQQQINSRVFLAFFHSYMGAGNPTTGHWRRRLAPMSPTTRTTLSRARGGPGI